MIRLLSFLTFFVIGVFSTQVLASENRSAPRYSKDSQLKWEDARLTGELKNVPVEDVLEELSLKEEFQLVIVGDLDQKLNTSFDHLTLEQGIKKIMRLTNLSYVIIWERQGRADKNPFYRIRKLIICQKEKGSLSSGTHRGPGHRQEKNVERADKEPPPNVTEEVIPSPPRPSGELRGRPKAVSTKAKMEFEGSPEDLIAYVDELLTQKRISLEEREMILEKMEEKTER